MTIQELTIAKDYLEQGHAILKACGCVLSDDIKDNINQLRAQIQEMQLAHVREAA